jgi:hypothetical protein
VEPVTVTLKLQLEFAANEPPVREIVRVAAVVVKLFVPPQAEEVELIIDKPAGNTSVKEVPVKACEPLAVLLMVKVSVVVEPRVTGSGENDLVMVGAGAGVAQPVNVTLSTKPSEPLATLPELKI